jgi:dipeptidase E
VSKRDPCRRVVLYSGGQVRRNALLHESLLELALRGPARGRRRVRMTYVPFTAEGAGPFFRRFERRYRPFGGTHFRCVPADHPELARPGPARRRAAEDLLASDVVYLAGGNTFYFLMHLRRSGLLPVLQRFAARGGVLAGMSAGAHLLTPHIGLAGYPPFDCDENEVGLPRRSLGALGVVGFEFFPHYRHSARYRRALTDYSRREGLPVYACRDGSGMVIEGDRVMPLGDVWTFDRGVERRVGSWAGTRGRGRSLGLD